MKLLITGMTGLIGGHLAKLCAAKGLEVHYLTRDKSKIRSEGNLKGFYWNPDHNKIDKKCIEGVDKIIHLAGASVSKRWTKKQKKAIISSRIRTGKLLYTLLESEENQVTQILSASAIGIYPSSLSTLYTEESTERAEDFLGIVAREWEDMADCFAKLSIAVTKVRIGLVLAPNGGVLTEFLRPIKYGVGSCLGSGKQWQSWIHVEDLVELFLFLLKYEMEGVYNGVAPNPVKQKYLIKGIARIIRRPLILPPAPPFILKFALGEMASMALSSQLVVSKKLEQSKFIFRFTQIEKALKDVLSNEKTA